MQFAHFQFDPETDRLGEGPLSEVYKAVDLQLGRTVALKVVRADRMDSSSGDQARQRFLHEALAISKVDHRNVVRVLDFGFAGDTPTFVVCVSPLTIDHVVATRTSAGAAGSESEEHAANASVASAPMAASALSVTRSDPET